MNNAISIKNLTFSYDDNIDVLKDLSLDIKKGSYVTILGHNGSGKSTLAKLMCFLFAPKSGEIYINGLLAEDKNLSTIRKTIGIVFQNPDNQFIGSTVEDDIAFGLENRNYSIDKMKELIDIYSKKVGMNEFLYKAPDELSGGQKQRVAIAGILSLGLNIIIFDEATSMLDPEGVEEIKHLIFEMKKENPDLTFISITHDIEEAYLSDRVVILDHGKIIKDGFPDEVFKNEEDILKLNLEIPFVLKAKNLLLKQGITIPNDIKTIEDLAEYLCK